MAPCLCCHHSLTSHLPQVVAKMKKTHTDLIHTIEMEMVRAGFLHQSLQPLRDHKAEYEEGTEKGGEWFNNSDNYKFATNAVIEAKLEVCCGVLKASDATDKEKELAASILFNKTDSAALAKGIATILPNPPLLTKYQPKLAEIAEAGTLDTLELEGKQISGDLPESIMKLMASARYFNLAGNRFGNITEGTALHDMVYGMTNWRDRKEVAWSDYAGGGKFTSIPKQICFFSSLVKLDISANELTGECVGLKLRLPVIVPSDFFLRFRNYS